MVGTGKGLVVSTTLVLEPRPEALPRQAGPERAVTLQQVCARLQIGVRTFYTREALGYWKRHGLIELPRPDGQTRGAKRLFSETSLDRLIAGGGRVRRG